jgi:predicted aldo/keto reductase-like oxidoreductase
MHPYDYMDIYQLHRLRPNAWNITRTNQLVDIAIPPYSLIVVH